MKRIPSGKKPFRASAEQVLSHLSNPRSWEALDDDGLEALCLSAIFSYGATHDGRLIESLAGLYDLCVQRIPAKRRFQNIYRSICDQVSDRHLDPVAFYPFLFRDPDDTIASTVALDLAALYPPEDGDPLTGPRLILDHCLARRVVNSGAVFAGLLALGDARVMEILAPARSTLSEDDTVTVSLCMNGFLFDATLGFLLDWMEELATAKKWDRFGSVAGAFYYCIPSASDPVVRSIERVFPSTRENAVRILREQPLVEFIRAIEPRLRNLMKLEDDPKVMPKLLELLGLPVEPRGDPW